MDGHQFHCVVIDIGEKKKEYERMLEFEIIKAVCKPVIPRNVSCVVKIVLVNFSVHKLF